MIKFENTEVMGWEAAIRGMRNPMNSWNRSDSAFDIVMDIDNATYVGSDLYGKRVEGKFDMPYGPLTEVVLGPNDLDLMKRLAAGGPVHAKYRRMITVYVDITAPLYWWKEFDTYKVGTVANSCSTMHKIHAKEFTLEDFSCEHLMTYDEKLHCDCEIDHEPSPDGFPVFKTPKSVLEITIRMLNKAREKYLETKDKKYWWQMIQLLPSSYNQKRTVMLNYEVLAGIYPMRKNHKLDEWAEHKISRDYKEQAKNVASGKWGFCDWIKTLPYSELITSTVCD